MSDCSPSEPISGFVFGFLFVFLIHAVPMAWLFRRWRRRYYLGLLPAAFCALGHATYFSIEVSCGITSLENPVMYLAGAFYGACYLSLIFFQPDMELEKLQMLLLFFLCIPLLGAIVATVWLMLSLGRPRLLLDTGKDLSLKERRYGTLAFAVMFILFGIYVASQELK